jgi:hypothetical protein
LPWVYHYTSRQNAQVISNDGELRPGASGGVYVSPDLYDRGAEALDRLAIPHTSPEMVFIWFADYAVLAVDEDDVSEVEQYRQEGRITRRGGGTEIHVPGYVDVAGARLLELRSP